MLTVFLSHLPLPLLLGQVTLEGREAEALREAAKNGPPKLFGTDITIILGVMLGLAALLFFWAFFVRKRPKQARGSLVVNKGDKQSDEALGSSGRRKRRKRRPDHPDNWGRNPTLGETGGLPPVRPDDPNRESPSEPETPPTS